MTFGEKLKQARKNKGYTQKELAELIKAKHNSISNWEKDQNKPDPDTIEIICGVLGIKPNYLFDKVNEELYTVGEENLIKKYRRLDSHGQEIIDRILDLEFKRIKKEDDAMLRLKIAARNGINGEISYTKEEIAKQHKFLTEKYPDLLPKK